MKLLRKVMLLGAALGIVACDDGPLEVQNLNNPDAERALSSPADVEALIGGSFNIIHSGHYGAADALWPQLLVMGFENASMNANFNMNVRYDLPRNPIFNYRGRANANNEIRDFSAMQRAARLAATGLSRVNAAPCGGLTCPTGTIPYMATASANMRARAFAHFVMGVGNGNAALAYDSAGIINERSPERDDAGLLFVPPLSGYADVMQAAVSSLDSAIAAAAAWGTVAAGTSANTDQTWMFQTITPAALGQLARSWKARFLAQVHRDSVSRKTGPHWDAVIQTLGAVVPTGTGTATTGGLGIPANFEQPLGSGWLNGWFAQMAIFDNWHQMPYWFIGMADTSGGYDAWLADPTRPKFVICTPDRRYPAGCDRTAAIAASAGGLKNSVQPAGQYFMMHATGLDFSVAAPHAESWYWHGRYIELFNRSRVSPPNWPILTKAESDLTLAEAYMRTGQMAAGIALLNVYRAQASLPPIATTAGINDPVPGGSACVPRVPAAPTFTTTKCGTVFDALKYTKRNETAYSGWGMWYFDGRGWGDLPENTPLHYPVPQQELDARNLPLYFLSGPAHQAPRGNYGF